MSSRFDDFRIVRLWRGLNRAVQLVLALTLVLGLNYLASQPSFILRRDLTASRSHSLSPETQAQLRNIVMRPVAKGAAAPSIEIYVTLPKTIEGDTQQARDLRRVFDIINAQLDSLLDAFVYESAHDGGVPVRVEHVDLTHNAKLYTELAGKLKDFDPAVTALVVRCGDRIVAVDRGELLHRRAGRKGQELDDFKGEAALLSALLEVTDQRRPVVYYTINHGELSPDAGDALHSDARFVAELKARRFDVRALNLEQAREVPADAELLFLAGPRAGFDARDTDKLRRYMRERNGRMLVLLKATEPSGLDDLFLDWGVIALNALVVDNDAAGKLPNGDELVRFIGDHATTKTLIADKLPLIADQFCPVRPDPGAPVDDTTLTDTELFRSSDQAWGERDYRGPQPFSFNLDKGDIPPPLSLGVAAERAIRMKGEARIPAGRLVVLGTADIAADARFDSGGNRFFLINSANWLVDRNYLVNVPVRPLAEFKLNATADDLTGLARRYALLPLALALLGVFVHFWRRRA